MTTPVVSVPVSDILSRLAAIPLDQSPFPHLVLDQVVPAECFSALLEILPALPFTPAEYPGTGRFTARHGGLLTPDQTLTHVGMVLQDWNASPLTAAIHAFLSGD